MNNKNTTIAFINLSAAISMLICFIYACAISTYNITLLTSISESKQSESKPNIIERTYIIEDFNSYREEVDKIVASANKETNEIATPIMSEATETGTVSYYDVPLSEDLQDYIFKLCEEAGIDPAIVIAMIEKESGFRESVVGDSGNSYGLMQIQPKWNKARMEALGCDDLLDPYQNVTVGINLLGELINSGNSIEWVLMAYNGGQSYANKKIALGIVSDYAVYVLEKAKNLVKI